MLETPAPVWMQAVDGSKDWHRLQFYNLAHHAVDIIVITVQSVESVDAARAFFNAVIANPPPAECKVVVVPADTKASTIALAKSYATATGGEVLNNSSIIHKEVRVHGVIIGDNFSVENTATAQYLLEHIKPGDVVVSYHAPKFGERVRRAMPEQLLELGAQAWFCFDESTSAVGRYDPTFLPPPPFDLGWVKIHNSIDKDVNVPGTIRLRQIPLDKIVSVRPLVGTRMGCWTRPAAQIASTDLVLNRPQP